MEDDGGDAAQPEQVGADLAAQAGDEVGDGPGGHRRRAAGGEGGCGEDRAKPRDRAGPASPPDRPVGPGAWWSKPRGVPRRAWGGRRPVRQQPDVGGCVYRDDMQGHAEQHTGPERRVGRAAGRGAPQAGTAGAASPPSVRAARSWSRSGPGSPAPRSASRVALMTQRLADKERRRRPSDTALMARATELSATYLGGLARPASVRWAWNQNSRWGSCTPADASIRISDRVKGTPSWVLDYVLLHELARLLKAGHGAPVLESAGGLSAHRAGAGLPRGARGRPRPARPRGRRPRPARVRGRDRGRRRRGETPSRSAREGRRGEPTPS